MDNKKLVKRKTQADMPTKNRLKKKSQMYSNQYQRKQYMDQEQELVEVVPQEQIGFALTDVKETVITENFYQPVPMNILRFYVPKGMM